MKATTVVYYYVNNVVSIQRIASGLFRNTPLGQLIFHNKNIVLKPKCILSRVVLTFFCLYFPVGRRFVFYS
jgi:hypothetical protein